MRKESVKTALVLVNYVSILEKWWKVCVCAKRLTNKRRKRVARCHCRCGCGITNIAIFTFLFVCDSCVAPLHSPLHTALERLQWKINILPSHLITSSRSILSFINDTIFYLFNRIRRCSLHTISCICLVNAKRGTSSLYLLRSRTLPTWDRVRIHSHRVAERMSEAVSQPVSHQAFAHSKLQNVVCDSIYGLSLVLYLFLSPVSSLSPSFHRHTSHHLLISTANVIRLSTRWILDFSGRTLTFFYSCLFAYRARPDFLIFHRTVQCAQMVTPLGHISYYWIQEKW